MDVLQRINAILSRKWTQAPNRASYDMLGYYGRSPRLDSVRALAQHCAGVPLKAYKADEYRTDGKNAPAVDSAFLKIMEKPCPTFPEIDGYSLRYMTFACKALTGEFGWLKVRDEGGAIVSLLPVPKAWILEVPTAGKHYFSIMPYGATGGSVITVYPQDFVWFKDFDLADPYGRGRGVAESIGDEIEADELASKFQKNYFYNDATPPYVVTGFNGNEAGAEKVKQNLMQKLAGYINARKPAVLTGNMDIKTLAVSPREMDMVESRRYLRDECLHHFRIPPEIMGIVENSNRATIDSAFYLFGKNVLKPELEWFERTVNKQLMNESDGLEVHHIFDVAEDIDLKLRIYQFGVQNGIITTEQYCNAFDIPIATEGHLIVPMGAARVSVSDTDTGREEGEGEEEEVLVLDDGEAPKGAKFRNIARKDGIVYTDFEKKAWKAFDDGAKSTEKGYIEDCKTIAEKQQEAVFSAIDKAIEDGKSVDSAVALVFGKEADEAVKRTLAKSWMRSMKKGRTNARDILDGMKSYIIDDVYITNEMFSRWIERNGLAKAKEINETTKKELLKKLREALAESIDDGDSPAVMAGKLKRTAGEVFGVLSDTRAKLIARTESATSVNYGQCATYSANGIREKRWVATLDNRTRMEHLYMHGVQVPMDSAFSVPRLDGGEDVMQYPADPTGSAENVCNCRCTVVPVKE